MKNYKGYYIDKVIFNNEKEVDDFIKSETIKKYQLLCKMFAEDACQELINMMLPLEDKLHKEFGLSYEEIEELEISAYVA